VIAAVCVCVCVSVSLQNVSKCHERISMNFLESYAAWPTEESLDFDGSLHG